MKADFLHKDRERKLSLSFSISGIDALRTVSVLFLFFLILQGSAHSQSERWRAFWVVRDALVSEENIRAMVGRLAEGGCNMVFVQVSGRGDAYYKSDFLPRAEALPDSGVVFDPLEVTVRLAHERGLEVHAWMNTFFVWSAVEDPLDPAHVVHEHPEWIEYTVEQRPLSDYDRPRPFRSEGLYLSPGLPEVRTWITAVAGEIADRYDIDGIHLDYIRYPGEKTGFHPQAVRLFQTDYGFDPCSLYGDGEDGKTDTPEGKVDSLKQVWVQWRCRQVTETVRMISERITSSRPAVKLSAAVKPEYDPAVEKYGQDWGAWMEEGLLDFVVPMTYSPSTDVVLGQIRDIHRRIGDRSFFAGIGIYNQPVSTTIDQIRGIRSIGVDGLSFFSYTTVSDDEDYLRQMRESCFVDSSSGRSMEPVKMNRTPQ